MLRLENFDNLPGKPLIPELLSQSGTFKTVLSALAAPLKLKSLISVPVAAEGEKEVEIVSWPVLNPIHFVPWCIHWFVDVAFWLLLSG